MTLTYNRSGVAWHFYSSRDTVSKRYIDTVLKRSIEKKYRIQRSIESQYRYFEESSTFKY